MTRIVPVPSLDKRKLDRQARESLRIGAVQRVLDGESPEEIVRTLDVARSAACRWARNYREGGSRRFGRGRRRGGRGC